MKCIGVWIFAQQAIANRRMYLPALLQSKHHEQTKMNHIHKSGDGERRNRAEAFEFCTECQSQCINEMKCQTFKRINCSQCAIPTPIYMLTSKRSFTILLGSYRCFFAINIKLSERIHIYGALAQWHTHGDLSNIHYPLFPYIFIVPFSWITNFSVLTSFRAFLLEPNQYAARRMPDSDRGPGWNCHNVLFVCAPLWCFVTRFMIRAEIFRHR